MRSRGLRAILVVPLLLALAPVVDAEDPVADAVQGLARPIYGPPDLQCDFEAPFDGSGSCSFEWTSVEGDVPTFYIASRDSAAVADTTMTWSDPLGSVLELECALAVSSGTVDFTAAPECSEEYRGSYVAGPSTLTGLVENASCATPPCRFSLLLWW